MSEAEAIRTSSPEEWRDFISFMKSGRGEDDMKPKSMHEGRPSRRSAAFKGWRERVLSEQLTASRAGSMSVDGSLDFRKDKDELFQECCSITGICPSRRQYSRWCRGFGGARSLLRDALDSKVGAATLEVEKAKNDPDLLKSAKTQLKEAELLKKRLISQAI